MLPSTSIAFVPTGAPTITPPYVAPEPTDDRSTLAQLLMVGNDIAQQWYVMTHQDEPTMPQSQYTYIPGGGIVPTQTIQMGLGTVLLLGLAVVGAFLVLR